jgi:predicted RNA binding protein YcfA (HicA-like mRNA interferase family)
VLSSEEDVQNRLERSGGVALMCMSVYDSPMDSRDLMKRLKADGWFQVAQQGDHVQFKHPTKPGRITVPHPVKDIPAGTLGSIKRQSGLTLREDIKRTRS